MEEILEIREQCKNPLELLNSEAFSRYLEIYKAEFIKELKNREDSNLKEDVLHKMMFSSNNYSKILDRFFNYLSAINMKTLLHIGLFIFWSIILIGTFKGFI